jgi:putative oxygen-independent coproporphyrinogen III oxidase
MPFHLYLHMPYCRRKCPYCDFFKKIYRPIERGQFVHIMLKEMESAPLRFTWLSGGVATVYFGGGTPSLHPPEEIGLLLENVRSLWGLNSDAEVTLEINPGTVDEARLAGYLDHGVNRLSIGAQSFSDRKLRLLYRDHEIEESEQCVKWARQFGFKNLSLDLIFGLPDETLSEWKADLLSALTLEPEHISLYNIEYHEGTPFYHWVKSGRIRPLSEDLETEMYLQAHNTLTEHGYEHYEISNFAKEDFRAAHNTAYWLGHSYLGLGPSAHSFDGDRTRYVNGSDMKVYLTGEWVSNLRIFTKTCNDDRGKREEWLSLALRLCDGITYNGAILKLGEEGAKRLWERASLLPEDLRVLTTDKLQLTPQGWFKENSVLLYLFEALK